jgi:enoyl-CoA hydratase/carnithine racemase
MLFTGRNVDAKEALHWGLVDKAVDDPLKETIEIAKTIAGNGPDAIWASREGILMALGEGDSFELGKQWKDRFWGPFSRKGKNSAEGIKAFVERRPPNWDRNWEFTKPKL